MQELRDSAEDADDDEADFDAEGDADDVLYIVEGQQLDNHTMRAWQVASIAEPSNHCYYGWRYRSALDV